MLTALRKHQRRSTLRLVAALGLVWLNMALNPCAMALVETDEHDCPHCPPAQHCDEQAVERCSYIDSIDSDGRTYQVRSPDFSDQAFTLPPVPAPVVASTSKLSPGSAFVQTTGPPGPPLYVTNCVYLN